MKKYIMTVLLLCCSIGAWADNIITLSNVQGAAGTEVTVSVSMTNTDAVSALQLSIPLADDLTFVENSQKAGARLNGHMLSAGVKDGILNVMVYSTTMAAMSGNDGEVCSFKLLLGVTPGIVSLTPSKAALTGISGNSLTVSTTAGTVDSRGAKVKLSSNTIDFGGVAISSSLSRTVWLQNVGNENLTITDISFSSSVFSTITTLPLTISAGSSGYLYVNCTPTVGGALDEEMIIISNNTTGNSTIRLIATAYGANELTLQSVSGMTDEEVTIPVIMKNADAINGFQMEITIPNELEYVEGSFVLSDRKQDHVVTASEADGILSVVAYSPTDKTFTGNDGEVGNFKVKIVGSSNTSLNISKAMMSSTIDGKAIDVLSNQSGCNISVTSPQMYISASYNYANNYHYIDFGSVAINNPNIQKTISVRNRGTAPLVISNVAFDNELFSIKEELPLTIEPSQSKVLTIAYHPQETGDFSTSMELYTNDPQKRLSIVKVFGNIFTPDYLMGTIEANRTSVKLNVTLNNYSDIYGIQFDINTTKEFSASSDNMTLAERGKNLSVSINPVSEGKLRVIAYVKNDQYVSSGEGKVMTIKLVPKEVLPEGDYTMTLSDIMLGSKGMKNVYAGNETAINFNVSGAAPGDANKDGKVGIGDIIAIRNIMAGKTEGYDMNAADANQDNVVNNDDIITIMNFMAGY